MSEPISPDLPPVDRRRSRIKLGLFAAFIVSFAVILVSTGHLMKQNLLQRAGPFEVEVRNQSTEKLRADVIVENRPTTIEMDPGEFALLRFTVHRDTRLRVDVYLKNRLTASAETDTILAGAKGRTNVTMESPSILGIQRAP